MSLIKHGIHYVLTAANYWIHSADGGPDRPVFPEVEAVCPALRQFEDQADVIAEEFERARCGEDTLACMSRHTDHDWRLRLLNIGGRWADGAWDDFPMTCKLLDNTPGLVDAYFSTLDPYKQVPIHGGLYAGFLRYHLGVKVPSENTPVLHIAGQTYTWEQGKGAVFDDTFRHHVENDCPEYRTVLIVDVPRPLTGLRKMVNVMFLTVGGRLYGETVIGPLKRFSSGNTYLG